MYSVSRSNDRNWDNFEMEIIGSIVGEHRREEKPYVI